MDAEIMAALIGTAAGAAGSIPLTVRAVSAALAARDRSQARKLRKRLRRLEGDAALCAISRESTSPHLLRTLAAVLRAAEVPAVLGVVCEDGIYTAVERYEALLGHRHVAGLPWADPRFVSPDDLGHSREVAASSRTAGNGGEAIMLLDRHGVRVPGRVWSTRPVPVGQRAYRLFVVLLERPLADGV